MNQLTFTLFLDYFYNNFAVTFVLCCMGVAIRNIVNESNTNNNKISITKTMASSIFSTTLVCAVNEYIDISFNTYALVCVLIGIWSAKIISLATNSKFMGKIVSKFLKGISSPIMKAVSDTLIEEDKDSDNKSTNIPKDEDLQKNKE